MNTMPVGLPLPVIANTPLVTFEEMVRLDEDAETRDDGVTSKAAMYLNAFVLNSQLAVKARDVARHRALREALHARVAEVFGEHLECLIDSVAADLYEELMAATPANE